MDIVAFLSSFYLGCPSGHLAVWTRQDKRTAYFDTSSFPAAAAYAVEQAKQRDVYFGVGLRREALGERSRGGKRDVQWLTALWLDVDIKGPGHKEAHLPETLEQATAVIDLCPLPPSIVIDSGGGLHAYWLLAEPFEVLPGQHDGANAAWKAFERSILVAARKKFGYRIDATANIDRVLRLPNTFNHKTDTPRPVESILRDDVRYDFRSLVAATAVLDVPKERLQRRFDLDDIRKRLRNLANGENRDLIAKVIAGEPFDPGERDTLLQRAASCVAFVVPKELVQGLDAAALAPLFEKSVEAMAAASTDESNPPPTMDVVIDKLSRALDDRARKIVDDAEIGKAFGAPDPNASPAPPPAATLTVDQYTPERLAEFAATEGVTAESFVRRWIIQHNSSYYLYVNGAYRSPVGKESLLTHAKDDLAAAEALGVRTWTLSNNGNVRGKTHVELLRQYATGARHLKGSPYIERSRYDVETETFWEAVCPVRSLEPFYDSQIDHWLNLLGGEEADKLLDWIATVLRLDLQSSCLYLSGEPSSGKTMLAHGLSRLFTLSGPALLEDVADTNFNADIARCPLVVGDEQVKCSTSELRRLVGSSSHVLKRKYLANVDLEGCLRIILADNSGKLIQGEELGGADMAAVASKFLHITVGKPPADYLRSIGGRAGTDGWVDGDRIARHALWLGLNRQVTLGSRLAVEGSLSRMARLLVVQDRVTGILCEWMCGYINSPQIGVTQIHGALVGDGRILVSAEAIQKFWTSYIQSERNVFSITKIGRALHNLAIGKEVVTFKLSDGKTTKRRLYSIRPELIYAWADENLSCDMDELRAKVVASPPSPTGTNGTGGAKPVEKPAVEKLSGEKPAEVRT